MNYIGQHYECVYMLLLYMLIIRLFVWCVCVCCSYYNTDFITVCDTICDGDEDELTDCYLTFCDDYSFETCNDGVVGITCSK